jgi:hypothetical protein
MQTVLLGCANLTPDAANCEYSGVPGHSTTVQMNFDLSRYPDVAIVQKAVLAVHVRNNIPFLIDNAQLRGRLSIGDQLQSVGANRTTPATQPGWVTFDVTAIAARAVIERRNSVSFELSLPCGRSESELTSVSVLAAEPRLIVEFR